MIDLRYIESLIESEITPSNHPSDEKLADFIDKKLEEKEREEVVNHLLLCDVCSDIVNQVIEYKKKPRFFNKIIISTPLIALVASIIMIVITPPVEIIGMIDLSEISLKFRADSTQKRDKIIDGDRFLKEITKTTDISYLESFFNQAEKKSDFIEALGLYQKAINSIPKNIPEKRRLKEVMIIHSKMLSRAIEEERKETIEAYKILIIDDIREYYSYELK